MTMNWRLGCAGAMAALALAATPPASAQLEEAVREAESATDAARESQERINEIHDRTGDLFREYRATLQRIESQRLYVDQQRVFLESQRNELAELERQIDEVDDITTSLLPMQIDMIDALEEFINLDLPFLIEDRLARVGRLRDVMGDPNVAPAERYRLILEAYQIEADYGRTLRTYEAPLTDAEDAPTVDFLLIGRLAYIYQTQDDTDAGIWDADAGEWRSLGSGYRTSVRSAIRMADEVTTPNVFLAPVPGPSQASEG